MSWIKSAKVGDKVVCVDAAERNPVVHFNLLPGMDGLREGAIYTVRSMYFDPLWRKVLLRVEEIERLPFGYVAFTGEEFETGFDPMRFRLIASKATDITIFTDMLKPVNQPVEEHA